VFSARYGLSPCVTQIRFVFKCLSSTYCNHGTAATLHTVETRFVSGLYLQMPCKKVMKYNNKIAGSRLSTVHVLNGGALRQTAGIPTAPAGLQSDTMNTTNLPATTLPSKTVQSAPWHSVCCRHDGEPYLANANNYSAYLRLQKLEVSDARSALLNSTISQYHTLYWNTVVPELYIVVTSYDAPITHGLVYQGW